jgi:hypothetical protein
MPRQTQRPVETVRRLAWTKKEAAASIGMSVDTFERRVQPFLKLIPVGQLLLVPVDELERWVRENAHYLVDQPS